MPVAYGVDYHPREGHAEKKKVGEEERKRVKCRTSFTLFGSAWQRDYWVIADEKKV